LFRPIGEALEARNLLSVTPADDYGVVASSWFAQIPSRLNINSGSTFIGPLALAVGTSGGNLQNSAEVAQWVVRLTPPATQQAGSVAGVETLLDNNTIDFQVLRGLGLPGQLLVSTDSSADATRAALAANANVASFEPNAYFSIQDLGPNQPSDPDYQSQVDLNNVGQFGASLDADINAPEAWNETTGSTNVVVGVIDSGLDYAHPDLYLNVWINQGEIPLALRSQLVDTDNDGRITFYDLNHKAVGGTLANGQVVSDLNHNGYIDAGDLLADPRWTDGVDTDHNSFVDDLVGWNFRSAADEPFAKNDPQDTLGHGTHVAGTIGAVGDNGTGVTGINWRSSLMALKFLDTGNSGQTADAVAAINYATMMRADFGEPVKVLNASFGQSGSESQALHDAIDAAGKSDMLLVAAAGNGNVFGQGINIDQTPFYPASSDLPNVISVAASGSNDELARFSNFGASSVDLAAPGIGVLSTLPGGRYGTENGTSMAAPHVAGAAALIWSALPSATAAEVRQAILTTAAKKSDFSGVTATGGRLDVKAALDSTVFAPRASLVSAANEVITAAGGTDNLVTVKFHDRQGIDANTIGDGDIIATRQWGPRDTITATYIANSLVVTNGGTDVTATYRIAAPGGNWDPLDFGRYVLSAANGQIKNINGLSVPTDSFDEFSVRVADPTVFYVNSFADAVDANVGDGTCAAADGDCTLRAAIQEANAAAPAPTTVILDEGIYGLSISPVAEIPSSFPVPPDTSNCFLGERSFVSSDVRSGDLDVTGDVTIYGNQTTTTTIDAAGIDRLFKVYPSGKLVLNRTTISGGHASDGGGILTAGTLQLNLTTIEKSSAARSGGGIAVWGGQTHIAASTLDGNGAQQGGGLFVCNLATTDISASAIIRNTATNSGGILSSFAGPVTVTNSTISQNVGGALYAGPEQANGQSDRPKLSGDGRFVAFESSASNLVPDDTNDATDIFVFDSQTRLTERVSVSATGSQGNADSVSPSISADGRFVTFHSFATNLVPDDTNGFSDVFVFDRQTRTIERVSVSTAGLQGNNHSSSPAISADGRFVAFESVASNFVSGDTNNGYDVFVFDRETRAIEPVSVSADGLLGVGSSNSPSISADGRFVAFHSDASNLVPGDTNNKLDIFVFDRQTHTVERISNSNEGALGNSYSQSPSISANGRYVAFQSSASNLVPDDTNDNPDVFVFDRQTRTVERESVNAAGVQADYYSFSPSISADGRFVAFESAAMNLVPGGTNGHAHALVIDRQTRAIELASVSNAGSQGDGESSEVSISADGRFVAFLSHSDNLIPSPLGGYDVYVHDREDGRLDSPTLSPLLIDLQNVTVAENQGTLITGGRVAAHNSLFVRNTPRAINLASSGYNFFSSIGTFFLQATDQVSTQFDNLVGPLQDNGGPTWSHALLAGSPAIDAADPSNFPVSDQRGVERPQDGDGASGARADLGAFEAYQASLGGIVFLDRSGDGKRSTDEPGIDDQTIYIDLNQNGLYDDGEPAVTTEKGDPQLSSSQTGAFSFSGLPPGTYRVAAVKKPFWSLTPAGVQIELVSKTPSGTPDNVGSFKPAISADGRFVAFQSQASTLVPGDTNRDFDVFVVDRQTNSSERVSVSATGSEGDNDSIAPSISADGRFVAFISYASNLVVGDTNGYDVFVFDRQTRGIERVNVSGIGAQADPIPPSISADGRFVAFASNASNLVPDDTNNNDDVFVFDRQTSTIERVSVSGTKLEGNDGSSSPSISADGRFVAFESRASNLVPGDTNDHSDSFIFDRQTHTIQRVSVSAAGTEGNGDSHAPSMSADGKYATFYSYASNLVPGDTNTNGDVFVVNLQTHAIERVSTSAAGSEGNSDSYLPTISADGRFVAFQSVASNLVPNDTNGKSDVFVFDRQTHTIERVNLSAAGSQGNDHSDLSSISADGRFVAYESDADNLVDDDINDWSDIFVTKNRRAPGSDSTSIGLHAGQVFSGLQFGMVPDPGQITGTCFDDVVANGVHDVGEPAHSGCTVFLDANANGRLDLGETSTLSAADGTYVFANLEAEEDYRVGVLVPSGLTLVLPSAGDNGIWQVHLPAGGTVTTRDFGFQPTNTTGQSQNATIAGLLYFDQSGPNKPPVANMSLFLDLNDNGKRDFDEPRTVSASDGSYSFTGLGNRNYTVRVLDDPHLAQTAPIGNSFTKPPAFSLNIPGLTESSPKDVVAGDFNGDSWPDLALPILDHDAVSILLNDQHGSFLPPKEVSLAPANAPANQPVGHGPISLVAGNFNSQGGDDLAVTDSYSSNVAILLDWTGATFASLKFVNVGSTPTAIARDPGPGQVQFLVVTNDIPNSTGAVKNVSILRNNGQGTFGATSADILQLSAGNYPSAIVTGYFNNDSFPDIAIADYGIHTNNAKVGDPGDVRIFLTQPDGSFPTTQASIACSVGYGPSAVVAADLNGDQKTDLAVANFLTNDITICQGNGTGTFTKVATLPGGSGPFDLAVTDIDADGDPDLTVADATSQRFGVLRNKSTSSTIAFDPIETSGTALIPGITALTLVAADFDHDPQHLPDIAVANSLANAVSMQQNKLISGAARLALTGVETVTGANFSFQALNLPPTLSPITAPPSVNEDSPPMTIDLAGITAGAGENQPLKISVATNNPSLIIDATPQYRSPSDTGSVVLTLGPDQSGQATITVTVSDGGLDNDLTTIADNATVQQTFTLTVNPLNDLPTLNPIPTLLLVGQNPTNQMFNLNGITAGGGESQPLRVTAATDNPQFIQNLVIDYTSGDSIATVHFATSQADVNTNGQITFTVTDGGLDNNLATAGDNLTTSRSIVILAISGLVINHAPTFTKGSDPQNITDESNLVSLTNWATDISPGNADSILQTVHFIVTSDNTNLFTIQPAVDSNGKLTFTTKPNVIGVAHVSVFAKDDGGTATGGSDQSDPQTFTIQVTKARVWHNAATSADVTGDNTVAGDDVLTIINYINAAKPETVPQDGSSDGPYVDVTGDGHIAADDVVSVINYINAHPLKQGEAIASISVANASAPQPSIRPENLSADLLSLIASDVVSQSKKRL
jgi:CSLREA domain-containing protein